MRLAPGLDFDRGWPISTAKAFQAYRCEPHHSGGRIGSFFCLHDFADLPKSVLSFA